ncbi:MAG: hypothetical protein OHK0039_03880 [Bacteroidia bacterium]
MFHTFGTILRKELTETLRDRRTLLTMFVIPALVFPLIIYTSYTLTRARAQQAETQQLRVGLIGEATDLVAYLQSRSDIDLKPGIALADTQRLLRADSLDLILWIAGDYAQAQAAMQSGLLRVYHQTTSEDRLLRRFTETLEGYNEVLLAQRLDSLGIAQAAIEPLRIDDSHNMAGKQEIIGQVVGGFLPYIFILFCFLGCFYPAIDLFTGEKERGTIETLLSTPVSRMTILAAKLVVVSLSGFVSALVGMTGLFVSIQLMELPPSFGEVLRQLAQPGTVLLILGMILPLAIFFAGLLVPFAVYARNFKEAQSTIAPLNILVIVPAALAMIPGIELTSLTALIPVMNVALASKEIVAGTAQTGLLLIVFASLVILAAGATWASVRRFGDEQNVLRT